MQLNTALIFFTALCTEMAIWCAVGEQPPPGGEKIISVPPPELQERSRSSLNVSSRVSGYTCYLCSPMDKQPCTNTVNCNSLGDLFDRCFISNVMGLVTQGCMKKELCVTPITCCEGHLCNSAPQAPPTALLVGLCAAVLPLLL